jgi:hypothetical protein
MRSDAWRKFEMSCPLLTARHQFLNSNKKFEKLPLAYNARQAIP